MEVDEQKEFDETVNNLSRKLKTKLSKLWEKAKDKNYAVQERAQVIIAGLIAYDSGHNRSFIQQFDRDYKLGESIAKSITAITT